MENLKKEEFKRRINGIFDDKIKKNDFKNGVDSVQSFILDVGLNKDTIDGIRYDIQNINISPGEKEGVIAYLDFLEGERKNEGMLEYLIYTAVQMYTRGERRGLESLKLIDEIERVEIKEESVKIILGNGKIIKFSLLSKYLEDFAGIDEKTKKKLESEECQGDCHNGSIWTSRKLPDRNTVVSGWISFFGGNNEYLHSWVEAIIGGKKCVVDYTSNVIMNTEGYEFITKCRGIKKISSSDIETDYKNHVFDQLGNLGVYNKEYVFFREEILRDSKRLLGSIALSEDERS